LFLPFRSEAHIVCLEAVHGVPLEILRTWLS
jgi:hypothetical protein